MIGNVVVCCGLEPKGQINRRFTYLNGRATERKSYLPPAATLLKRPHGCARQGRRSPASVLGPRHRGHHLLLSQGWPGSYTGGGAVSRDSWQQRNPLWPSSGVSLCSDLPVNACELGSSSHMLASVPQGLPPKMRWPQLRRCGQQAQWAGPRPVVSGRALLPLPRGAIYSCTGALESSCATALSCMCLAASAHMCAIADDILFTWDPGLLRRWLGPHAWSQCCPALAGRCQPCCQGLKFEPGHCSAGPAAAYPTAPGVLVPNSPVRTFLRVSNQINYNSGGFLHERVRGNK